MNKLIILFYFLCSVDVFSQATHPSIKNFIVVNWTTEQFSKQDIKFSYLTDSERFYNWDADLQAYSSKSVQLDTVVNSVMVIGLHSSPVLTNNTSVQYIVHRQSQQNLQISLIKTTLTNEIIGINICNNINTFGRVRQFIVANLSNRSVTLNSVTHQDGSVSGISAIIPEFSISVYPIGTEPIGLDYVQGKAIRTYDLVFSSGQNQQPLKYNSATCTFGTDNMVVGVEISNSGTDSNKVKIN